MDGQLLAFITVATLLTVTPGMDMALITRNVLRSGVRAGWVTSAGVLTGVVGWAALSAVGIAALLAASAVAFSILKLVGGVYLVYLGLATLWQSRNVVRALEAPEDSPLRASHRNHFREGLVSNLLNPKVGLFYTTLLPQFVSPGAPAFVWIGVLAGVHLVISIAWLALFAWLVWQVKRFFDAPRARQLMERLTGVVLIGFGGRIVRQAT